MEIKDYLHLYLPVAVELNNGGSKVYNRTAVAVGNMDDEYRYVTLRLGVGAKSFTNAVLFSDNRVKPILRPLSDMTEDEMILLIRVCHPEKEYPILDKIHFHRGVIWFNAKDERMRYFTQFSIGDSFKPEETKLLLSKHFDLFGLIESGLAIDAMKTGRTSE